MTLIRWNPNLPARTPAYYDEIDRLFEGFLGRPFSLTASRVAPPVDVEETKDAYVLRVDLPGFSREDVKVRFTGDTLTLSGERKREGEKKDGTVHHTERVYGSFERSFTLPEPVKAGEVKATYKDGVLEIRVPKADEAKVREIEVQVG
jgi:HSP20 family protein